MAGKLLHVLGGGPWQVPTVRLARSMGYRVLVTDMYQERPAYALADFHEVCDIADREATCKIAERHGIHGIVCDTTDVGVPTAAYVAERLGLPGIGYDTALHFTDKHRMRQITTAAGVQDVRFKLIRGVDELRVVAGELGFPLVLKPTDNQSSRGVHRVDAASALEESYADAVGHSRSASVLAEEFLPGVEVTVEGFCLNGTCYTLGISDKDHFAHRPEVARRLTYPAAFPAHVLRHIKSSNEAVVRALGLSTGVTHAEFMVDGDDVRLVEIAARGGGTRVYSDIAPYVSGIDAPRAYLEFLMGEAPRAVSGGLERAAHLEFFDFPSGRVRQIKGVEEARRLPQVHEIMLEFETGDILKPPQDDRSRPGFMVLFGANRGEVLEAAERVKQLVSVEVAA